MSKEIPQPTYLKETIRSMPNAELKQFTTWLITERYRVQAKKLNVSMPQGNFICMDGREISSTAYMNNIVEPSHTDLPEVEPRLQELGYYKINEDKSLTFISPDGKVWVGPATAENMQSLAAVDYQDGADHNVSVIPGMLFSSAFIDPALEEKWQDMERQVQERADSSQLADVGDIWNKQDRENKRTLLSIAKILWDQREFPGGAREFRLADLTWEQLNPAVKKDIHRAIWNIKERKREQTPATENQAAEMISSLEKIKQDPNGDIDIRRTGYACYKKDGVWYYHHNGEEIKDPQDVTEAEKLAKILRDAEETVIQQATSLIQETDTPITENDLERYRGWKKTEHKIETPQFGNLPETIKKMPSGELKLFTTWLIMERYRTRAEKLDGLPLPPVGSDLIPVDGAKIKSPTNEESVIPSYTDPVEVNNRLTLIGQFVGDGKVLTVVGSDGKYWVGPKTDKSKQHLKNAGYRESTEEDFEPIVSKDHKFADPDLQAWWEAYVNSPDSLILPDNSPAKDWRAELRQRYYHELDLAGEEQATVTDLNRAYILTLIDQGVATKQEIINFLNDALNEKMSSQTLTPEDQQALREETKNLGTEITGHGISEEDLWTFYEMQQKQKKGEN